MIHGLIQYGDHMKSITIHSVDKSLEKLIKSRAQAEGLSINKTIKKLLEESLGAKPRTTCIHREAFESFCGIWKDDDLNEFNKRTGDLSKIDADDWK